MSLSERVAKLSLLTGFGLRPEETAILRVLQAKVINLEHELKSKEQRGSYMDEILEQTTVEVRAQEKLTEDMKKNFISELGRFQEGDKVLKTFEQYLKSKDFEISRLRHQVEEDNQQLKRDLKPYHDTGKKLKADLEELIQSRAVCIGLRERMAKLKGSS